MSARDVLVLAEVQRNVLADVTLELLTAARGLAAQAGGQVVALVLSPDGASYAPLLGAADRIVLMDDPHLAGYSPEPFLAALHEVVAAEGPRAVLIGATSIGWDLGPLLAARLDAPLVTGCKAVEADGDALRVTTSFCGGKMMAELQVKAAPAVLVVLPGSFRADGQAGQGGRRTAQAGRAACRPPPSPSTTGSCPRPATWTSRSRTRSWRWGAASNKKTTWSLRRSWRGPWAARSAPRVRWWTKVGCPPRGKWASRA